MALLARMFEFGERATQRTARHRTEQMHREARHANLSLVTTGPEQQAGSSRLPTMVPAGEIIYAIGDIHGKLDLLENVLEQIRIDANQFPDDHIRLVFLGDYIDRGPDSAGVIDYVLHRLPPHFDRVFLRGNHEDYALKFLRGDLDAGSRWLQFGGAAFLASYGINPYRLNVIENMQAIHAELLEKMPPEHIEFLKATQHSYDCGDYYFVHAGVRPNVELDFQDPHDKMWIREEFLHSEHDFGKIVVHGHSIAPEPDIQANRIGLDTGAYATGHLCAMRLRDADRHFFTT